MSIPFVSRQSNPKSQASSRYDKSSAMSVNVKGNFIENCLIVEIVVFLIIEECKDRYALRKLLLINYYVSNFFEKTYIIHVPSKKIIATFRSVDLGAQQL